MKVIVTIHLLKGIELYLNQMVIAVNVLKMLERKDISKLVYKNILQFGCQRKTFFLEFLPHFAKTKNIRKYDNLPFVTMNYSPCN